MEDVDYITISDNDDDEVEVLGHLVRDEPIVVDLTETPRKERKVLEELPKHSPQPPQSPLPPRSQRPTSPSSKKTSQSNSNGVPTTPMQDESPKPPTPPPEGTFNPQRWSSNVDWTQPTHFKWSQPAQRNFRTPQWPQWHWKPKPAQEQPQSPQPQPAKPPESQSEPHPARHQQPAPRPDQTQQTQSLSQESSAPPQQDHPRQQQNHKQHPAPQQQHSPPPQPPKPRPPPAEQQQQAVQQPVKRTLSDRELMVAKKEQGNKKFRCNAFDEAVRCYRAALDLSRKLDDQEMAAVLHFNLAMSYDKLGSYTQAADECAAAVRINDKYIKAHVKRAEIFMARGKYDEAVICYEHICELDSTKRNDAFQRIAKAKALSMQVRKPDQYEILGLKPHFTAEQLKTAYKQKARAHHPDRHSDADVVTRRIHEKIFKEASEANTYFRKRFNFH